MSIWYALCELLPLEMLQWDFMKNALLALLLMAPLFGILSTMIVTGRMSFFSDALGHSAFTGIAIGSILGLSKSMRELVLECLERVHGTDLIDKRVGTLSGGELQRVLLALALEPLPNILILDEPLSGVDIEGMENLMDMLDEIRREYDLSILMTTHDFSMLRRYADQVVLIDHTVLIQGSPDTVLDSEAFSRTFHMKGGRA